MGIETSPSNTPQAKQPWKVPLNDLSRSWLASPEAQEVLCKVAASGTYSLGPQVAAFEEEFADYLGVRGVVGVASGTDALEIALRTVGAERGDTIVSVANAGGYTSIAAAQIGARVRYCDVDPHSLLMSAESLDEVLTPEIKAVVVTHLYGNVVDMDPIVEMCGALGIAIIEDCAQATGATYKGRRVGGIGDIAAFSFYPTKNLGCMGDGGAVVTSNRLYTSVARKLRQYGWTSRYHIDIQGGRNSRLDELQGGLLRTSLPELDQSNEIRRQIQNTYRGSLKDPHYRFLEGSACSTGVAHLSVLLANSPEAKSVLSQHLTNAGVQNGVHYPVADHKQHGLALSYQTSLPVTESASARHLSIPIFPGMSQDQIEHVCFTLKQAPRV